MRRDRSTWVVTRSSASAIRHDELNEARLGCGIECFKDLIPRRPRSETLRQMRKATVSLSSDRGDQIVGNFLAMVSQIADAHQRAKGLYLRRFAPDYNTFDFIEPDEMRLSKIVAWFLNPRQTHGQGSVFLRLFLDPLRLNVQPDECDFADVQTEVTISGGRLDVLVSTTSFRLAIENKPWAGDLDTQLVRYLAHFDSLGVPQYQVIYLTSNGRPPPEHSIPEAERERRIDAGQLELWGYDLQIQAWLARCRAECRADRVSMFIDEFSRYIRSIFEGVRDRTMSDHLLDEIVGSADRVSAAMQIILLADTIRRRLLSDLGQQVCRKLPGRDVKVVDNPWERYSGLTIEFSQQSPYGFGMEFQNTQFNGLIMGIYRKVEKSQPRASEYDCLVNSFGNASQNDWWLWYRWASPTDSLLSVPQNWNSTTEPWIDIAKGQLASRIADAFARTHTVLNECAVG
jgi:PD-(D/E)XK nuclease superfamily